MEEQDDNQNQDSTAALKEKLNAKKSTDSTADIEELTQKLAEMEEKANLNWDKFLRLQAEMENTKRRMERDLSNAHKYAIEKFVLDLLPVIDSMERSLTITPENDGNAILEGVSLILKMFNGVLEKFGVEQVNPEGDAFNPELHQAVSTQADADVENNHVINVLQKGYLLNKRLIRPAMVIVSKS